MPTFRDKFEISCGLEGMSVCQTHDRWHSLVCSRSYVTRNHNIEELYYGAQCCVCVAFRTVR